MIGRLSALAGIAVLVAALAAYTVLLFPALDRISGRVSVHQEAEAAIDGPWEKAPPPCFFIGRPEVFTDKACGGVHAGMVARWELYCEADPDCMELPDGTPYAEAMAP